jgi:hypothetical protein
MTVPDCPAGRNAAFAAFWALRFTGRGPSPLLGLIFFDFGILSS